MTACAGLPHKTWVFDIDGTLLDSQGELRPRTVAALDALHAHGATLLVATALPQRYARVKLGAVPFLCECGVFLGGGQVLDEHSGYSYEVLVDGAVSTQVLALLEAVSPELQILVQYGDARHALRLAVEAELLATWGYDEAALLPYRSGDEQPFTKVIAWHEALDLGVAYRHLQARLGDRARFYLTDGGHALQVTAAQATKGIGLSRLLRHLGVRPADAIAFGDGAPDVEMLALVGTGVAMGNAVPEVLAVAQRVIGTNDEEGVAAYIEAFLRQIV